jgi:hypothetical protein
LRLSGRDDAGLCALLGADDEHDEHDEGQRR